MKRFIILSVAVISGLCHAHAQDVNTYILEETEQKDSVIVETPEPIVDDYVSDATEQKDFLTADTFNVVDGKNYAKNSNENIVRNLRIKHQISLGLFVWGQDDFHGRQQGDSSDEEGGDSSSDILNGMNNYGFSLDYKLKFTPLQKTNGTSVKNPCNLGYSAGIILAGDFGKVSDNTEFSWDILASAGISLGYSNVGIDLDLLGGIGANNGCYMQIPLSDIPGATLPQNEEFEGVPETTLSVNIIPGNQVVFKYGFQVAFKIGYLDKGVLGSLFNALSSIGGDMYEISLVARYLMSTSPEDFTNEQEVFTPIFPTRSIQIGIMFNF